MDDCGQYARGKTGFYAQRCVINRAFYRSSYLSSWIQLVFLFALRALYLAWAWLVSSKNSTPGNNQRDLVVSDLMM